MYYEKLALEIYAKAAGWEAVKPAACVGESGVEQRFSFLAKDNVCSYGFDIYNDVTEEEVLRTFMKRTDTKVLTIIVSLSGRPRTEVSNLADEYGITILGPADIEPFFNPENLQNGLGQQPLLRSTE